MATRPCSPPAPSVTLRTAPMAPFDGAIAAARTCYSPRVIGAGEVTDVAARHDRRADLRRRPPHGLPARALRVRAREHLAAVRLDVPALVSVLQLRAVEPALRQAAASRARSCRRSPARRSTSTRRAVLRAWDRYAELSALLKDDAFGDPEGAALRPADDDAGAAEADREGRREARHRDRALRDPDRRVHLDGAHRVGHRAASAAPDDATPATRRTRRAS